jgi:pimeloyl-ACP methyl ester carboxylesterase
MFRLFMPSAAINGINLHYELAGSGRALLFVHGFLGRGKAWKYQIKDFSKDYMVIAPDMRGHGKTERPHHPDDYTIELLSSDLRQLLKKLNVKRCCMVGHSWGSKIVTQFATEYPEMLAGMVLISGSGQLAKDAFSDETWNRLEVILKEKGWVQAFLDTLETDPEVSTFHNDQPEKIEKMRSMLSSRDKQSYEHAWAAFVNSPEIPLLLKNTTVPALLICGANDLPKIIAHSLKTHWALPRSWHLLISNVRHFPQDDAPDITNDAIAEFIDTLKW